ncbi:uncharacterized protein N7529_005482 [Penicillium soppii]|uniref:uncharacterized protein n=1 Tax=Penicillium soppii TaxID=69789 RepID=UPI002547538E|nr:uncharacterized protein N7529_005482 [Penicillium soppii]KAJ5863566.1 hypothetical protein N7529_005482 [Penicillium soppii]
MSTTGDNYTIHKVSLKRTRQACGPCRRKKARCPGEKPTCSLCHRLGQCCSYGTQTSARAKGLKLPSAPSAPSAPTRAQDQETNRDSTTDGMSRAPGDFSALKKD